MCEHATLSEKVITDIAKREGVSPTELTPLHAVVDPDALDALFQPTPDSVRMDGDVSFRYCGYRVTANADGCVELTRLDG
ncbi:HalOD1 output domain-containing protein [Halorientalis brevis]|uniref:HalOD1 output domain-containing protein n=1 Tax=Halorientalis brevis TaxID=1126241 RepID=UPI001FFB5AEC